MKFSCTTIALGAFISMSACTTDDLLMVDPMGAMDLMAGDGSVARAPKGETTFRFVIPEDAFASVVDTPQQLEEQRNRMLAQWVGTQGICADGYRVGEPTLTQGFLVYEGACNA